MMLKARGIYKQFGGKPVLEGIDLDINKGEVVAIIGPSGSGKSTLLRCLNQLDDIDQGYIAIDNQVLVDTSKGGYAHKAQLRKLGLKMGFVFQSFNLFPHFNILKNLTQPQVSVLGRSREVATKRAKVELLRVGLSEKEAEYPYMLSGGQQQRAAIARALCMDPELLCFDEPTSALDPLLTQEVLKVIRDLAGERWTMCVVTHEMAFAKEVADRVVYMKEGKVQVVGTPAEIFSHPEVLLFTN